VNAFEFHNPTKVIFGNGTTAEAIGRCTAEFGTKILFIYGRDSIKRNGTYDKVTGSLEGASLSEVTEYSGVKSNPCLSHLKAGIALARDKQVDVILAVGGGSVIDEAKGIAAGVFYEGDVWDFYSGKAEPEQALPIIAVPTLPATASEMNGGTVITHDETHEKFGFFNGLLFPKVAVMDPEITHSISKDYTAYAGVDAISHLIEGYFTGSANWTPIQDRYVEGLVKTIMEATDRILENPEDNEARSVMMWAATMAWNGLGIAGIGEMSYPNHMIEHPLSGRYDIAHGAGLSIVIPAWMRFALKRYPEKFARFAREVFQVDTAEKGIDRLEGWFQSINSPTTLAEGNIPSEEIPTITADALELGRLWGISDYTQEDIESILCSAC
jgi:alcohol dehydrogenase YqhD (iron-dependent ADH family)